MAWSADADDAAEVRRTLEIQGSTAQRNFALGDVGRGGATAWTGLSIVSAKVELDSIDAADGIIGNDGAWIVLSRDQNGIFAAIDLRADRNSNQRFVRLQATSNPADGNFVGQDGVVVGNHRLVLGAGAGIPELVRGVDQAQAAAASAYFWSDAGFQDPFGVQNRQWSVVIDVMDGFRFSAQYQYVAMPIKPATAEQQSQNGLRVGNETDQTFALDPFRTYQTRETIVGGGGVDVLDCRDQRLAAGIVVKDGTVKAAASNLPAGAFQAEARDAAGDLVVAEAKGFSTIIGTDSDDILVASDEPSAIAEAARRIARGISEIPKFVGGLGNDMLALLRFRGPANVFLRRTGSDLELIDADLAQDGNAQGQIKTVAVIGRQFDAEGKSGAEAVELVSLGGTDVALDLRNVVIADGETVRADAAKRVQDWSTLMHSFFQNGQSPLDLSAAIGIDSVAAVGSLAAISTAEQRDRLAVAIVPR
jgi:hypothetical protein